MEGLQRVAEGLVTGAGGDGVGTRNGCEDVNSCLKKSPCTMDSKLRGQGPGLVNVLSLLSGYSRNLHMKVIFNFHTPFHTRTPHCLTRPQAVRVTRPRHHHPPSDEDVGVHAVFLVLVAEDHDVRLAQMRPDLLRACTSVRREHGYIKSKSWTCS